jgi:hypothetical protein
VLHHTARKKGRNCNDVEKWEEMHIRRMLTNLNSVVVSAVDFRLGGWWFELSCHKKLAQCINEVTI